MIDFRAWSFWSWCRRGVCSSASFTGGLRVPCSVLLEEEALSMSWWPLSSPVGVVISALPSYAPSASRTRSIDARFLLARSAFRIHRVADMMIITPQTTIWYVKINRLEYSTPFTTLPYRGSSSGGEPISSSIKVGYIGASRAYRMAS